VVDQELWLPAAMVAQHHDSMVWLIHSLEKDKNSKYSLSVLAIQRSLDNPDVQRRL
jgi:uncharacterized protein YjgD (DUF1641 family)